MIMYLPIHAMICMTQYFQLNHKRSSIACIIFSYWLDVQDFIYFISKHDCHYLWTWLWIMCLSEVIYSPYYSHYSAGVWITMACHVAICSLIGTVQQLSEPYQTILSQYLTHSTGKYETSIWYWWYSAYISWFINSGCECIHVMGLSNKPRQLQKCMYYQVHKWWIQ